MTKASVEIREQPLSFLAEYATIPISFEVERVLRLVLRERGLGGVDLVEEKLPRPYVKDYDAIPGNGPTAWASRFDLTDWAVLTAHREGALAGGATVAFGSRGVDLLEGRDDLAVLWDLRVAPPARQSGVGAALFEAARAWAATRGCSQLKIETQNVNVPACRFYEKLGCTLGAFHRYAYPDLPDEVQLFWYRDVEPLR